MRSIAKYLAVGALVTPLVIGSAGFASADDGPAYERVQTSASAGGGVTRTTASGFTPDGKAYFVTKTKRTRPTVTNWNDAGSRS
ncbi:hypothetical protein [Streptomyces sp. NPDC050264]|uniref:hypothetical protein n=1 Tax=Streptomyces sp. NPDC050264 TaxID=3155038 RepID=UPI0034347D70